MRELTGSSMYCVKGESEKLCMEVKAYVSADVFIRGVTGSDLSATVDCHSRRSL